jgi:hypothetical protein
MFALEGAAMCSPCRPNSECRTDCVDASNCTCVKGFVDIRGECRRCLAGMQSLEGKCEPCQPGLECAGGPEVRECRVGTYSLGNRSACAKCTECAEITTARCNRTHDSVCERAVVPLVIVTIRHRFTTQIPGDTFRLFSLVYASAIPRAMVDRFCDLTRCIYCFQGLCPAAVPTLHPPTYELTLVLHTDVNRLSGTIETITQTDYLKQTAGVAMGKLTEEPFILAASVEHTVICPDNSSWNGVDCVHPTSRTWAGLAVAAVLFAMLAACGYRQQQVKWARVSKEEVAGDAN